MVLLFCFPQRDTYHNFLISCITVVVIYLCKRGRGWINTHLCVEYFLQNYHYYNIQSQLFFQYVYCLSILKYLSDSETNKFYTFFITLQT